MKIDNCFALKPFASLFLLVLLSTWWEPSLAQHHYDFKHFTPEDGLASSEVYGTIEDSEGQIWCLTDKGLSRYDGFTFTNYTKSDGLTNNIFYKVQKTQDGKIWLLGKDGSICTIEIMNHAPHFEAFPYNDSIRKYVHNHRIPNQFKVSEDGEIFMTVIAVPGYLSINQKGEVEGTLVVERRRFRTFGFKTISRPQFSFSYPEPLPDADSSFGTNRPLSIHFLKQKELVTTQEQGNHKIHFKNGELIVIPNEHQHEAIGLGQLDSNLFWIGYRSHGVKIFKLNGELIQHLFKDLSVAYLYQDEQEGLWVSTLNDGLFYNAHPHITTLNLPKEQKYIYQIVKDAKDGLYFSTHNGKAYHYFNDTLIEKLNHPNKKDICIASFKDGSFVGAYSDKLFIDSGKFIQPYAETRVYHLKCLSNGVLQYCAHKGYIELNRDGTILKSFDLPLLRDACYLDEWLFLASDKGLFVEKNGEVENYSDIKDRVNALVRMGRFMIVGTHYHGIYVIDQEGIQEHIPSEKLAGSFITSLYREDDHTLWVCTEKGASKIWFLNSKSSKIRHIRKENGLPSNETSCLTIIRDTVYLGTREGICFFPSSLLDQPWPKKPIDPVKIKEQEREAMVQELNDDLEKSNDRLLLGLITASCLLLIAFVFFRSLRKRILTKQNQLRKALERSIVEIKLLQSSIESSEYEKTSDQEDVLKKDINEHLSTPLSRRELDVLKELSKGKDNKEIAEALFVSVNTVRTHLAKIYVKLDVKNRLQAVKKAVQIQENTV